MKPLCRALGTALAALAIGISMMGAAAAASTVAPPVTTGATGTHVFTYTGKVETYTVPAGVGSLNVIASGGNGGGGHNGGPGGPGIEVDARHVDVSAGERLLISVGGQGHSAGGGGKLPNSGDGGFNGGGDGARGGGGGGGFSYVQGPSGALVIAGGGGGGAGVETAGGPQNPPGTLDGQNGDGSLGTPRGGLGGTLTHGGSGGHNASILVGDGKDGKRFDGGSGGVGIIPKGSNGGAGGGGGYFGGGGGAGSETGDGGGGGGGSSFVTPDAKIVTIPHSGPAQIAITPNAVSGPAASLSVDIVKTMTAGGTYDTTVTAKDSAGETAISYRGTVHFTSSTPGALPVDYRFTAADRGSHTFRSVIRFLKATDLSITANDTEDKSITGAAAGIHITQGPVARLTLAPKDMIVDKAAAITVEGVDEFGNVSDLSGHAALNLGPNGTCTPQGTVAPTCTPGSVDPDPSKPIHELFAEAAGIDATQKVVVVAHPATIPTSLELHSSTVRSEEGKPVTFTVTVPSSPSAFHQLVPTGTVTFIDNTRSMGAVALTNRDGKQTAVLQLSNLAAGPHKVVAQYMGDEFYEGSQRDVSLQVGKTPTHLAITPSANPSPAGSPLSFTVVVTSVAPSPPNGEIFVRADNDLAKRVSAPLIDGKATVTMPKPLGPGTHQMFALYVGDDTFAQSNVVTFDQKVEGSGLATSTSVTSSSNTPEFGEPVTFTASVAALGAPDKPTGTVRFDMGGRAIGGPVNVVNGKAQSEADNMYRDLGNYAVTASYLPAGSFAPSSGTVSGGVTVQGASTATSLQSSANPSDPGGPVDFTATVVAKHASVEGRVQFSIDGQPVADAHAIDPNNGTATIRLRAGFYLSLLTPGTHNVSAQYIPFTGHFVASASQPLSQDVRKGKQTTTTVVSSDRNSEYGQPLTFTASVATGDGATDLPGDVQFGVDGKPIGPPVTLVGDNARSASVTDLTVGQHRVSAAYLGSSFDFASSEDVLNGGQTVTVAATTAEVTSSANPFDKGAGPAPEFTVHVSAKYAVPTGQVQLTMGTYSVKADLVNGTAPFPLPYAVVLDMLKGDVYRVNVSYYSDSSVFSASKDSLDQLVK
ncbi:MAG TPA: Ig-like domain-containing protein [Acidimicrobiales bacterium]|jgi:hypothetical protein|nr:Ig-like domain-containing protein [Acidimicrobiales bacterium]